ncbi:MAG: TlpA family protein disulfide reductase [Sphingomonadaceae bacterium]|nr:TlpA family protein disulfide reductase [Sphingomonadaceae bacterium]
MRSRVRLLLGIIAAAVALIAGLAATEAFGTVKAPPFERVAALSLPDRGGTVHPIDTGVVAGRPTIVSLWATWCVPCRVEAAALAALRHDPSQPPFNLIYINVDQKLNPADANRFLDAAGARDFDYFVGGERSFRSITGALLIALPRVYVYDAMRKPTAVFTGFSGDGPQGQLRRALAAARG